MMRETKKIESFFKSGQNHKEIHHLKCHFLKGSKISWIQNPCFIQPLQKISKAHHKWLSSWIQKPCFLQTSPKIPKTHDKWLSSWIQNPCFLQPLPPNKISKAHHKWRSYWIRRSLLLENPWEIKNDWKLKGNHLLFQSQLQNKWNPSSLMKIWKFNISMSVPKISKNFDQNHKVIHPL